MEGTQMKSQSQVASEVRPPGLHHILPAPGCIGTGLSSTTSQFLIKVHTLHRATPDMAIINEPTIKQRTIAKKSGNQPNFKPRRGVYLGKGEDLDDGAEGCVLGCQFEDILEDEGENDQGDETALNEEVHDRVWHVSLDSTRVRMMKLTLEDNLPTLTPLTERVDWRSDLLARRQPEQHGRVQPIKVRDDSRGSQDEEQDWESARSLFASTRKLTVASDKVGRVQAHLNRLDDKFSRRLAERVRAETAVEPNTSPPCSVGLVVLELSGEEGRDEDLENTTLDRNDGDKTKDGVRGVPGLEEPLRMSASRQTW